MGKEAMLVMSVGLEEKMVVGSVEFLFLREADEGVNVRRWGKRHQ